jgi:hypothetical protein
MPARSLFLAVTLLAACAAARAQALEPGEWEIRSMTTSPLSPNGQSAVFRHCLTKADAEDPERWMARQSESGPCTLTPAERTAERMEWDVACPLTRMHGRGSATITGPGSVESELRMTSEFQGYRFQMHTRATARRLGPCKS